MPLARPRRWLIRAGCFVLASALPLLIAGSARANPFQPRPVLRIDWVGLEAPPRVRLFVTDLDEAGRARAPSAERAYQLLVNGLPEQGAPKLSTVSDANEPSALAFVVQLGPTMESVLPAVKEALGAIVQRSSQTSHVRVIGFANDIASDVKAASPAEARDAIQALAIKPDALEMALAEAVQLALAPPASGEAASMRRVVAVISDGTSRDINPQTFAELARYALESSVRIHTVGYVPIDDVPLRTTLSVLSKKSRGTERQARSEEQLKDGLKALADEILHQRILDYDLGRVFTGQQYDFQIVVGDVASEPVPKIVPKHDLPGGSVPWRPIAIAFSAFAALAAATYAVFAARRKKREAAQALLNQLQETATPAAVDFGKTMPGLRTPGPGGPPVIPVMPAVGPSGPSPSPIASAPAPASASAAASAAPAPGAPQPPIGAIGASWPMSSAPMSSAPMSSAPTSSAPMSSAPMVSSPIPASSMAIGPSPVASPVSIGSGSSPAPGSLAQQPPSTPFALPRPTEFLARASVEALGGAPPASPPLAPLSPVTPITPFAPMPGAGPNPLAPPTDVKPASIPPGPRFPAFQQPLPAAHAQPHVVPAPPPVARAPNAPVGPGPKTQFVERKTQVMSSNELESVDVAGWLVPLPDGAPTLALKDGFTIGGDGSDLRVPPRAGRPNAAKFELDPSGRWAMSVAGSRRLLEDGERIEIGGTTFLYKFAARFPMESAERKPYLQVIGGLDDGRRIIFSDGAPKVIGSQAVAGAIVRGPGVAALHAVARLEGGRCEIADLGGVAEGGLKASGQPVASATLSSGQEVQIGSIRLVFRGGERG